MFIKRGGNTDGKILKVIESEKLTDDQKKAVKEQLEEEIIKNKSSKQEAN